MLVACCFCLVLPPAAAPTARAALRAIGCAALSLLWTVATRAADSDMSISTSAFAALRASLPDEAAAIRAALPID
jgi:hypothetical protein